PALAPQESSVVALFDEVRHVPWSREAFSVDRRTETTLLVFIQLTISAQPGVSPYWGDVSVYGHRRTVRKLSVRLVSSSPALRRQQRQQARRQRAGAGGSPTPASDTEEARGAAGGNDGNGNCGNVSTPPPRAGDDGNV
ncbi:hypothetical protein LTS06_012428, partial [Exophiala xenobiotica]